MAKKPLGKKRGAQPRNDATKATAASAPALNKALKEKRMLLKKQQAQDMSTAATEKAILKLVKEQKRRRAVGDKASATRTKTREAAVATRKKK